MCTYRYDSVVGRCRRRTVKPLNASAAVQTGDVPPGTPDGFPVFSFRDVRARSRVRHFLFLLRAMFSSSSRAVCQVRSPFLRASKIYGSVGFGLIFDKDTVKCPI